MSMCWLNLLQNSKMHLLKITSFFLQMLISPQDSRLSEQSKKWPDSLEVFTRYLPPASCSAQVSRDADQLFIKTSEFLAGVQRGQGTQGKGTKKRILKKTFLNWGK